MKSKFIAFGLMGLVACSGNNESAQLQQSEIHLDGISSNGGQAISCPYTDGPRTTTVLLDYKEIEFETGWNLTLALERGNDWKEIAKKTVKRLHRFDSERERRYTNEIDNFFEQAKLIEANLDLVADNNGAPIPFDCTLVQAAIRREPQLPGDKLYTISKPVWHHLDDANKAGLVLHEIILNEALAMGQETSRLARYFNANLASAEISDYSFEEYEKKLVESKLFKTPLLNIHGAFIKTKWATYYDAAQTKIKSGYLLPFYELRSQEENNGRIIEYAAIIKTPSGTVRPQTNKIEFHESGAISEVSGVLTPAVPGCDKGSVHSYIDTPMKFDQNGFLIFASIVQDIGYVFEGQCYSNGSAEIKRYPEGTRFQFHHTGVVKSGLVIPTLNPYEPKVIFIQDQKVGLGGATLMSFHASGHVAKLTIFMDATFKTKTGSKSFPRGNEVEFDEEGYAL